MIVVTGTFEIDPQNSERVKHAATAMSRATRAEEGCITYAFWQSIEDAGLFRVYEEWEDLAALKAHGETTHMADFRAALPELLIRREVVRFEAGQATTL